jgi:hypothetical protein
MSCYSEGVLEPEIDDAAADVRSATIVVSRPVNPTTIVGTVRPEARHKFCALVIYDRFATRQCWRILVRDVVDAYREGRVTIPNQARESTGALPLLSFLYSSM